MGVGNKGVLLYFSLSCPSSGTFRLFSCKHHIVLRVCGFIYFSLPDFFINYFSLSPPSIYFSIHLSRPLDKHTYNFSVSFSPKTRIFPLSLSLSWTFPFCLTISLMCVGGCLVCVLIFFYLLHLLLLAIYLTLIIFFHNFFLNYLGVLFTHLSSLVLLPTIFFFHAFI